MKLFITFIFVTHLYFAIGQTNGLFSNLTKTYLQDSDIIFGYDNKTTSLIQKKCKDLPEKDCPELGEELYKVGRFKNDKIQDELDIFFSEGASDDPHFIFSKNNGKILGEIYATELYINNNGIMYSAGHTNNMFDHRRKFQLSQDTLIEFQQPYYYVGLKSKTIAPLILYQYKKGNSILAQLPKGYDVEVLLCDTEGNTSENYYLVKTDFGLVGWMRVTGSLYDTPIKGLTYAGD